MTRAFASEKNALGICDRCGFSYKLRKLRKEIVNRNDTNVRVCPECYDPDHPQNQLGRQDFSDPQALRNPRVDAHPLDITYDFTTSLDDWRVAGGGAVGLTGDGAMTYKGFGIVSPVIFRDGTSSTTVLSIDSTKISKIEIRFKRIERSPSLGFVDLPWVGELEFFRDTDSSVYQGPIVAPEPSGMGADGNIGFEGDEWKTVVWEVWKHSSWSGTIDGVKITLFEDLLSSAEVDYIRFVE